MKLRYLGILAVTLLSGAANATAITRTFNIDATFNPLSTVSEVIASFTITWDPTVNQSPTINGITVNNSNVSDGASQPWAFRYTASSDSLSISDDFAGTSNRSFSFGITNAASASPDLSSATVNNGPTPRYSAQTKSLQVPASVPEPATWGMMIGGFGMIGTALRRQRRQLREAQA